MSKRTEREKNEINPIQKRQIIDLVYMQTCAKYTKTRRPEF